MKKVLFEAAFILIALVGIGLFFWACQYTVDDFRSRDPIPKEPLEQYIEAVDSITYEGERSSKWRSVRDEYVRQHPRCEACGSTWGLNVHHVQPFASHPELELDEGNLITLCREHHFRIGHDPDGPRGFARPSWLLSNPNVREDAASWQK
jgi:5-methylcytosine-specific restriction endonuclease McrA